MDLQPTLKGAALELHPLAPADLDALYAAASDPLVWEQHPNSDRWKREVFERFFAGALASRGALAILDSKTGAVIGSSRYYDWDASAREVAIGFTFMARAYWGGAFNRELKSLMLDHAFGSCDAVVFHVWENNLRSRKAMEKIGGVLAGREERVVDGKPVVSVVYRIARLSK
jgi:RimJ/RimL family protein N-acetyltransferase